MDQGSDAVQSIFVGLPMSQNKAGYPHSRRGSSPQCDAQAGRDRTRVLPTWQGVAWEEPPDHWRGRRKDLATDHLGSKSALIIFPWEMFSLMQEGRRKEER